MKIFEKYLEHNFDILGSGWVKVSYGMQCSGILGINYNNKENLKR